MKSVVMSAVAVAAGVVLTPVVIAPPASAMYYGNYNLNMPDRRDFHTWIFSAVSPCQVVGTLDYIPDCIHILTIPQPVAKAAYINADAQMVDGRYTMTIDDPYGLRCGDIYYGPTIPTHDVYSWDATTLAGEMVSTFDVGCDGAPGGAFTYPFSLTRM